MTDTHDQIPPHESPPPLAPVGGTGPAHAGQLASEGQRILAILIDWALIIPISMIPILGWIAGIGYHLTKDALPFLDGQSIGKKLMKIRVVSSETRQPITGDYGASAIRGLALMIPFFFIVELIMICTRPEKNRFGDDWAKTRVIVDNG